VLFSDERPLKHSLIFVSVLAFFWQVKKNPMFEQARNSCDVTQYADAYYSMTGYVPPITLLIPTIYA
jgi:SNF family Na+-dependent transporter